MDKNDIPKIFFLVAILCPMPRNLTLNCVKNMILEYEGMNFDPIFGSNVVKI